MSGAARRRHQYPERRTTKRTQKAKKPASSRCWTNPAFPVRHIARPMRTIYERHDYAGDHRSSPGAWSRRCCQRRQSDRLTHTASSATTSSSQAWYERALKSDPNHVLTWQYYRPAGRSSRATGSTAQYHLSADRADLRHDLRCIIARWRLRLRKAAAAPAWFTGRPLRKCADCGRRTHASARLNFAPSVSR